jgi:hypothetical protein
LDELLNEDGEKNWRDRDDEFEVHSYSRQQTGRSLEQRLELFLGRTQSLKETLIF